MSLVPTEDAVRSVKFKAGKLYKTMRNAAGVTAVEGGTVFVASASPLTLFMQIANDPGLCVTLAVVNIVAGLAGAVVAQRSNNPASNQL